MKTLKNNEFVIQEVEGFKVVRDDLYEGGTKKRALEIYMQSVKEDELVYGCDYRGCASYAIALVARDFGKKVKIFFMGPKQETAIFKKVTAFPNVSYEIKENVIDLKDMAKFSKEYAQKNNAKFLPLGLDFIEFQDALTEVVKSAHLGGPEIWVLGGTGNLARAIQKAYPEIPVNVVNLKSVYGDFGNAAQTFDPPESFHEDAQIPPPYPSVPNYDAKVWRFVKEHGRPGAYVWNVYA